MNKNIVFQIFNVHYIPSVIFLLRIELVKMYIFKIFKDHYTPSVILLFLTHYSVQYWTCEHIYISDSQDSLCSFSYYFGHIILLCTELVNMNTCICQLLKVHYIPSVNLLFWPHYYVQYWTWKHEYVYCFSYCGVFMQTVAEQRLRKQISTETLFSIRSASRTLLCNSEVNTSRRQLVDTQQWEMHEKFSVQSAQRLYNETLVGRQTVLSRFEWSEVVGWWLTECWVLVEQWKSDTVQKFIDDKKTS
jgi:hypothetical protein